MSLRVTRERKRGFDWVRWLMLAVPCCCVCTFCSATDSSVLGRFVSTGGGAGLPAPAGALRFMQRPAGEVLTIEEYFSRREMGGPAAH